MPGAAEVLAGINKKAKTAAEALLLPVYDSSEQKNREPGVPLTEIQKAWDDYVKAHKEGGDVDAARKKYDEVSERR